MAHETVLDVMLIGKKIQSYVGRMVKPFQDVTLHIEK